MNSSINVLSFLGRGSLLRLGRSSVITCTFNAAVSITHRPPWASAKAKPFTTLDISPRKHYRVRCKPRKQGPIRLVRPELLFEQAAMLGKGCMLTDV